ncbi:MAG: copper chaperone PCu(A)C [Rhizomicrobium sp.]
MRSRLFEIAAALAAGTLFVNAAALNVSVSHAYLRLIPGVPAAGYFTLSNRTKAAITLTGAHSADCGMLMMHRSSTEGGMARMEDASALAVAAGRSLSFAPGGYHLMCMDPSPRLRVGGTATVTLEFGGGATSDVAFTVVDARGRPH